jgi:hypothetical protein
MDPAALERFAEHRLLDLELSLVARMLILAPAAGTEVWAPRHDALRGRDHQFLDLCCRVAAFLFDEPHAHLLAGQGEGHKDGLAIIAGQERATIDRLLDLDEYSSIGLGLRRSGIWLPRSQVRDLGHPRWLDSARLHCWLM